MKTPLTHISIVLTVFVTLAAAGCGGDSGSKGGGAGSGSESAGTGSGASGGNADEDDEPVITECNDGIDNDGDGLVDWQRDLGCANAADDDEAATARDQENGWTTFDPPASGKLYYVSAQGSDDNDGLSPETALASISAARELVGEQPVGAWILLRRGDVFEQKLWITELYGKSADDRVVFASYGESKERPILLNDRMGSIKTAANIAIAGIEVRGEGRNPDSDSYVGPDSNAGARFVFSGENLLIEGCKFTFGQVSIIGPSRDDPTKTLDSVEFRRNVVYKAYSVDSHAQGLFASKIDGLLVEDNVFDHNGWLIQQVDDGNDQKDGQATIFNHDMYLSANDLIVRNNLILRSSSIGIKMRSDVTEGVNNVTIEKNVFFEGEVGISLGGNTDEPRRFIDSKVLDNVFLQVGRARPTNRGLAWAIGVTDNDGSEIAGNYILHQDSPETPNSHGISLGGGTLRDVHVHDNVMFRLNGRGMKVSAAAGHENIVVEGNVIDDGGLESAMVRHEGSFDAYTYQNNAYASANEVDEWFKVDGDRVGFSDWQKAAGASGSMTEVPSFVDPDRDLATYNASLGGEDSDLAFIEQARQQSPWAWNPSFTSGAIRDYVSAGFETK